jgi:hypothetical protein
LWSLPLQHFGIRIFLSCDGLLEVLILVVFHRARRLTFEPKLGHCEQSSWLVSRHQTVIQQPRENDAGNTK